MYQVSYFYHKMQGTLPIQTLTSSLEDDLFVIGIKKILLENSFFVRKIFLGDIGIEQFKEMFAHVYTAFLKISSQKIDFIFPIDRYM